MVELLTFIHIRLLKQVKVKVICHPVYVLWRLFRGNVEREVSELIILAFERIFLDKLISLYIFGIPLEDAIFRDILRGSLNKVHAMFMYLSMNILWIIILVLIHSLMRRISWINILNIDFLVDSLSLAFYSNHTQIILRRFLLVKPHIDYSFLI